MFCIWNTEIESYTLFKRRGIIEGNTEKKGNSIYRNIQCRGLSTIVTWVGIKLKCSHCYGSLQQPCRKVWKIYFIAYKIPIQIGVIVTENSCFFLEAEFLLWTLHDEVWLVEEEVKILLRLIICILLTLGK